MSPIMGLAAAQMFPQQDGDRRNIDDLQIITSILYHPGLLSSPENTLLSGTSSPSSMYMLEYHQQRMLAAVSDLSEAPQVMLRSISGEEGLNKMQNIAAAAIASSGPSRMRFALDNKGELTCKAWPLPLNSDQLLSKARYFPSCFLQPDLIAESDIKWLVGIGKQELKPDFTTKHKTSWRSHYSKILEDAPTVDARKYRAEMLVVNTKQEIMEGCITTPYFWHNNEWITPSAHCGGNLGTTRRWALEKGCAVEGIIRKNELKLGQLIMLSNGAGGFSYGRIVAGIVIQL